ncbi:MAG: phytoene desaturase [Rhizobiaceae bacterium]|nr:phytoene desaturase [Rhizobiaceae bacterium]
MLQDVYNAARRPLSSRYDAVVVGAGMGGLVAALMLAARGWSVAILEKSPRVGGKLREIRVGDRGIDAGPTVFTMRPVFEAIFAAVGARLDDYLKLTRAEILARHHWQDGSCFDLHADKGETADAVGRLAGAAEARGYLDFCRRTEQVFQSLNASFMEHPSPSPLGLARNAGLGGLAALTRIRPFTTLSKVVEGYFCDPRLRQIFGRYATYCGSSPFEAPGPLMLIAHVEQSGVWLVEGGMIRIAEALESLARQQGVDIGLDCEVAEILIADGAANGVRLASGQVIEASAVVFNGDPAALFGGLAGDGVRHAVPPWGLADRSLSAITWSILARAGGFPLSRHTVFFSSDYRREFADIFDRHQLPSDPTIYICAQDRDASLPGADPRGDERLLLLVNAPARADDKPLSIAETQSCERSVTERLARAGLVLEGSQDRRRMTTPSDFAAMFPGSGGALYGRASHGWMASFQRPGARARVQRLYLAGGAVHPGPGIPMAALSGTHAAQAAASDLASTASFHAMATPGGMSTRSATTGSWR